VGGSGVDSFNSMVNGKVNTLQQQGEICTFTQSNTLIFYYTTLPVVPSNAEMTLDFEANEFEVKVLKCVRSLVDDDEVFIYAVTFGPCTQPSTPSGSRSLTLTFDRPKNGSWLVTNLASVPLPHL
jgi:hypothetical protein